MALIDVPAYALTDQELWTPKAVKEALVAAFITVERTAGRAGPKAMKSSWALVCDLDDVWENRRESPRTATSGRQPRPVSARDISRSELVLEGGQGMQPWLRGPLAGTQMRDMLELWVLHEVGKEMGYTRKTLQALCEARGWAWSTFKRQVQQAAGVIAGRLNHAMIELW